MTNKDLTKEFMKEIDGFRLNVTLGLDVDYDVYSETDINKTLSKLSDKFISVEEHEKLKTFYYDEIRKLSKFETPRIKKLKAEHEKEIKELKQQPKCSISTGICKDFCGCIRQYEHLEQQLSQSISIKDVEKKIEWLKERSIIKSDRLNPEVKIIQFRLEDFDKAFKSLNTQTAKKEKR